MINQKILVVGPSWLGDMVMAQALFKHLKLINNNRFLIVLLLLYYYFNN